MDASYLSNLNLSNLNSGVDNKDQPDEIHSTRNELFSARNTFPNAFAKADDDSTNKQDVSEINPD